MHSTLVQHMAEIYGNLTRNLYVSGVLSERQLHFSTGKDEHKVETKLNHMKE